MCGGRGERLGTSGEKPLLVIGGRPMIDHVLTGLQASRVSGVSGAVTPAVPETMAHLGRRGIPVIRTAGDGYVEDLDAAVAAASPPVLVVAADLPLLDPEAINRVLDRYTHGTLSVYVPTALKRELGVSVDLVTHHRETELSPAGVNIIGTTTSETRVVVRDHRFAVNVNRPGDGWVAEALG